LKATEGTWCWAHFRSVDVHHLPSDL